MESWVGQTALEGPVVIFHTKPLHLLPTTEIFFSQSRDNMKPFRVGWVRSMGALGCHFASTGWTRFVSCSHSGTCIRVETVLVSVLEFKVSMLDSSWGTKDKRMWLSIPERSMHPYRLNRIVSLLGSVCLMMKLQLKVWLGVFVWLCQEKTK